MAFVLSGKLTAIMNQQGKENQSAGEAAAFYNAQIRFCTDRIHSIRQQSSLVSLVRVFLFLGLAAITWSLINGSGGFFRSTHPAGFPWDGVITALVLLILFIILVLHFYRLKDRKAFMEQLLFVNNNELSILRGQKNAFPDGQAFLRQEGYLDDLDIFGPASLYHALNRTTTSHGAAALSGLLRESLQSGSEIRDRQDAIRALAGQPELRQSLIARGLLAKEKEGNLESLSQWLESPLLLLEKKWVLAARWAIVVYNSACLVWLVFTGMYQPLVAGILAGWLLTGIFGKYIVAQHRLLGKKQAVLDQYAAILRTFSSVDTGHSGALANLREEARKAHAAVRSLAKLASYFDQQLNMMVSFLLNNLFLYNLYCMIALERWKSRNREEFSGWIRAVGDIECFNSIAAFAYNNPDFSYPVPQAAGPSSSLSSSSGNLPSAHPETPSAINTGGRLFLETTGMGHPLISPAERVDNDFTMGREERLILVTGSNMSGKTTFLRTIGVNLLLAQCGAPVCAKSFQFTPMQLLTSLRISDSLQEHTSYFMAELKKLKQIIHQLQTGRPSLVLIDEILRGTNSEDKTYGSEQFIFKLLQYHCLSLFATHDLTLGALEQTRPGEISNYCFESIIEDGELHFNYRLQRGIARNRNASFLMEKMEII